MLKPNERIDELYSLGIKVIQDPRVFSFSTDAVLLAHFANLRRRRSSLTVDLGTGNGAVALFLSQRTHGRILGVEIQPKLAEMARRSVRLNHLGSQVRILTMDLARAPEKITPGSVDTVTCNPPYFKDLSTSIKNPDPYLAIARHEIKTNLTQVLKTTNCLLKNRGKADLVFRPGRLIEMLNLMQRYHLAPKRLRFVYSTSKKSARMFLIEAEKAGRLTGLQVLPPLIIMNNGHYSKVMHRIMSGPWN